MKMYRVVLGEEDIVAYFENKPTRENMIDFLIDEIADNIGNDLAGDYTALCEAYRTKLRNNAPWWIDMDHEGMQGNSYMMIETIKTVNNL